MNISFIGAGNMAGAIIRSLISSGRIKPDFITVYDVNSEKTGPFSGMGVNVAESIADAVESSGVIFLAVKPQDYDTVLSDIRNSCANIASKMFVSIAAAISTSYVCKMLGCDCPVVRVMPNTPLLLGFGATAVSRNSLVSDKEYSKICGLFASSGTVTALDEEQMNKVISVNGSSPAYVYLLAKAMIDGGVEQGLDRKACTELVLQTMRGSVEMLMKSSMTPDELIKMVASPNGTTEAALKTFEKLNFEDTVYEAMNACTLRAEEMSK